MILPAVLGGGALFLALYTVGPRWAALAAVVLTALILADVLRHEARTVRDRATAMRRWREWQR